MLLSSLRAWLALASLAAAAEQTMTFAAGCFWSVELAYQRVPGVTRTAVVYAGGAPSPVSYEQVTTGRTGHAEAVEVAYDPAAVSSEALVDLFWHLHDPTSRDRQGGDVGTQYRSAIWYHADEQRTAIESSRARYAAGRADGRRVVTEVAPAAAAGFVSVRAEEYHQRYLEKGGQPAEKGSLVPIQCYGNRGPIKQMDKPEIRSVLRPEL